MSSINALGQVVFQYIQQENPVPVHVEEKTEPVVRSDPDGDGNAGAQAASNEADNSFGAALELTLQHYGIDPHQFQRDYLSALTRVTRDRSAVSASLGDSRIHINTLG